MPSQPELPAPRAQPPVSMTEKIVTSRHEQQKQQQQSAALGVAGLPVILTTDSVMKKLPVSLSSSLCDTKVNYSISTSRSDSSTNLVVVSTSTAQGQSVDNKNLYKLSEVVMKEKDSLFKVSGDSDDSMYVLEPPRSDVQTVRMRSKNFFTLMEEEEDGDSEKKDTRGADKDSKKNIPKYTPVFNVGQSLHQIFHSKRHHKHRKGHTVPSDTHSTDTAGQEKHDEVPVHTACHISDNDVQHENFVELYEKISMNTSLRRNASQPSLEKCSMEDFLQAELGRGFGMSQSQPTTPQVSPLVKRRNSLSGRDKPKVDTFKPEESGPGLSFLASVAGEIIYKKKKDPASNLKYDKAVAELRPEGRPIRVRHPSNPDNDESDTEQLSLSPKRNDIMADMRANALQKQGENKNKKSFIKSFVEWGTSTQATVGNKETNMFSPTSF